MLKGIIFASILSITSYAVSAQEQQRALSTSNWIPIDYIDNQDNRIEACSGDKAVFSGSYVALEATKFRIHKEDGWVKRLFNNNRRAFAVVSFKGNYLGQSLDITRIGNAKVLKGSVSNVDLGTTWNILNTSPWTVKNASLGVKVGYSADSTLDFVIKSFSDISSSIPDYTASTGIAVGSAIASTVDNLLFGSDRITSLLSSERDLPVIGRDSLCSGYYALYAAKDATKYDHYEHGDVTWSESSKDLLLDNQDQHDISYVVVKVTVQSRYYNEPKDALNDTNKVWSQKYREAQSDMQRLFFEVDRASISAITNEIKNKLIKARTFLDADLSLVQSERIEIHRFVVEDIKPKLAAVNTRIAANTLSAKSTSAAIDQFVEASRNGKSDIDITFTESFRSKQERIKSLHDSAIAGKQLEQAAIELKSSIRQIELAL